MNDQAKILVAGDEDFAGLAYAAMLAGTDYAVDVARDALQAMARARYDVVLLSDRDGLTILKQIRQRWPESEVVVISSHPTVESAKEAVSLGAFDYLAKPVAADDVRNAASGAMLRKKWALRGA